MLLVGLTMPGRSVGEGQTKQHPGPPAVGDWAWGQQPYLIKNCTSTETSRRIPRDTTAWGVNRPLARRPMTPGSESQVHLETHGAVAG